METLADQWMEQGTQKERHRTEEWIKQEKDKWERQAELKNARETLIDLAADLYFPLPEMLSVKIRSIQSIYNLRFLTRKIVRTESLDEFTEMVNRAVEN